MPPSSPAGSRAAARLSAIGMGAGVGLIQGITPAEGVGAGAFKGASALTRGFKDAAANALGSGLQEAASTSFDPSLSTSDRASRIVDAAVGAAQVGGLFGLGLGMLHGNKDTTQKSSRRHDADPGRRPRQPRQGRAA